MVPTIPMVQYHTQYPGHQTYVPTSHTAPTRHFVVLRRVWFLLIKYIFFEAYFLLAPKCRVGADRSLIWSMVGTIGMVL